MKKIRILHIITNLALGGAQKNALYISANLNPEKYEKYFISAPSGFLYDDIAAQNKSINFQFLKCLKRRISPIQDVRAFFFLARYLKQNKISIVHTHSSKAGIIGRWAAKFAQVPIIIHSVHGWSFNDYLAWPVKAGYVLLERLTALVTTRFIAVSENDINKGLANKIGTAEKYALIRYGIEINKFDQAASQIPSREKPRVGMIACLKPQKKPLDFIKAAAIISQKNKNIEFICIGDGVLRPKLAKEIQRNNLNEQVKILGWRADIPELLAGINMLVLSSLWEGLPIAILEAMAAARPVIAYDTDGIIEAVQHGQTGYLVAQGDFIGLAEQIQKLLDNPRLANTLGQAGRKFLQESVFSAERMMQSMEKLYAHLLIANGISGKQEKDAR
ncbi:MAG: glycosyltransferase family 4 protein [Candidatus Omnitrophica bacterium]|nr:glycosyltransferase family 4 protein [Candidatus Omnitrophota bacterium]